MNEPASERAAMAMAMTVSLLYINLKASWCLLFSSRSNISKQANERAVGWTMLPYK